MPEPTVVAERPTVTRLEVLRASVGRELTLYRRDLRLVIMLVIMPLAMIVLVGSGLSPDVSAQVRTVRIGLVGPGAAQAGPVLARAGFHLVDASDTPSDRPFAHPAARVRVVGRRVADVEVVGSARPVADPLRAELQQALVGQGGSARRASGSDVTPYDTTVPGLAVMFGFFLVPILAANLARESLAGTWTRLTVLPVRTGWVLGGKVACNVAFFVGQLWLLLLVARVFWSVGDDMGADGLLRVTAVGIGAGVVAAGLGLLVATLARSLPTISQFSMLVVFVPAAVSGALVPLVLLPHWVALVAPFTPMFWAVREVRATVLGTVDWGETVRSVGILLVAGAGLLALGVHRIRRLGLRFDG